VKSPCKQLAKPVARRCVWGRIGQARTGAGSCPLGSLWHRHRQLLRWLGWPKVFVPSVPSTTTPTYNITHSLTHSQAPALGRCQAHRAQLYRRMRTAMVARHIGHCCKRWAHRAQAVCPQPKAVSLQPLRHTGHACMRAASALTCRHDGQAHDRMTTPPCA
jgi:hypothetical protein